MTTEETNYKANVEDFINKLNGTYVDKIIFSLDKEPVFDVNAVPFHFEYSIDVFFLTQKGNYKVTSAQTSEGTETFWIEQVGQITDNDKELVVNSVVKNVHLERASNISYAFKMSIQFENKEFYLYCGEIYDDVDNSLQYNIYDEMLLAFDSKPEAMKFESLINYKWAVKKGM
jgi:hypothetical protein